MKTRKWVKPANLQTHQKTSLEKWHYQETTTVSHSASVHHQATGRSSISAPGVLRILCRSSQECVEITCEIRRIIPSPTDSKPFPNIHSQRPGQTKEGVLIRTLPILSCGLISAPFSKVITDALRFLGLSGVFPRHPDVMTLATACVTAAIVWLFVWIYDFRSRTK
jgi:hypothetical protein